MKEKTADEMFEELGYMTDENKYRTIYSIEMKILYLIMKLKQY